MVGKPHTLLLWGDLACFTRPEMKVERYSYPVITPSAARGVLDSILWPGPGTYWQVTRIDILRPIRYISLRRNEVKDRVPPPTTVLRWANGSRPLSPIMADGTSEQTGSADEGRTQRQTVALKDVRYRLHAHLVSRHGRSLTAADAQFQRRARAGQCIQQPYMGCREFPADFELDPERSQPPLPLNLDLGLMLYDTFPLQQADAAPAASLFHAILRDGVLEVPPYDSDQVLKAEAP